MTVDLGLRWEYYDPIIGLAGKGSLSNYDPATNSLLVSGYGNIANDFGVKKDFNNFSPRLGADVPPRRQDRHPRRVRRQHDAVPRQPVRVQLPGQAEQQLPERRTAYSPTPVRMAAGFPAPIVADDPGRTASSTPNTAFLRQSLFYVPNDLQQGTLYSWNVAFQRELVWGLTG